MSPFQRAAGFVLKDRKGNKLKTRKFIYPAIERIDSLFSSASSKYPAWDRIDFGFHLILFSISPLTKEPNFGVFTTESGSRFNRLTFRPANRSPFDGDGDDDDDKT
ncbi:hypothetical protein EGR_00419 [Echinococcus granulosus]|uniref:Uncharacterized protein n=1 Tax=Echinococcus granulosus TaxID=6210 RepID=W6VC94_ECHGR|nr:hypothetical protein EGR_00419 [Echinococcus granulosus]EUB64469.1 hypothetical protein EGR_00419 [Echinococcus granulosus]